MEDLISTVLGVLIATFGATISVFIATQVFRLIGKIKQEVIKQAVYQAVLWASGKFSEKQNKQKFNAVMEKLQKKFKWLPADQIEELIEATIEEIKRTMPKKLK